MRWRVGGSILLLLTLPACSASPPSPPTAGAAAGRTSSSAPSASVPAPSTSSPPSSASFSAPSSSPVRTPSPTSASPRDARSVAAPVVLLDPGHNGGNAAHPGVINAPVPDGRGGTKPCNTTGTATDAGYAEHAFNWDVALRLRSRLTAAGVRVALTRSDDRGVGPCVDVRGRMGARTGAAAFVGIHGDGAPPAGRGFHVITSSIDPGGPAVSARSTGLARAIRDAMTAVEPVSNYLGSGGLDRRSDLAGLNLSTVPAVYVECGNMRNSRDASLMSSSAGRDALAARLAAGVLAFLGR